LLIAGCGSGLLEVMARLPSISAKVCTAPFRKEQSFGDYIEGCHEQVLMYEPAVFDLFKLLSAL
jgi:hypothetical protein